MANFEYTLIDVSWNQYQSYKVFQYFEFSFFTTFKGNIRVSVLFWIITTRYIMFEFGFRNVVVVEFFEWCFPLMIILFQFKHIYFSSIEKQVLATYINHSRVRFLEQTSTGVVWGNMVVTRVGFEPTIPRLRGDTLSIRPLLPLINFNFKIRRI